MKNFENYFNLYKNGLITKGNFYKVEFYNETLWELIQELKKYPFYTFTGRYEDFFYNSLSSLDKNENDINKSFENIIDLILQEFKKRIVPNMIILPLNFLKSEIIKQDITFSQHMKIFLPIKEDYEKLDNHLLYKKQQLRKARKIKADSLSKHVEDTICSNLDKEHILITKDKNFFNYPILTIDITNIDYKVEQESGRIVEAVYTILRMFDLKISKARYDWGVLSNNNQDPANTYVVYYNEPSVIKKPPYDNGYGYSFRYNFAPMLDIDSNILLECGDRFYKLLNIFVSACFLNEHNFKNSEIEFIKVWKNSMLMFNTAYEFASIEKYDSVVLILLSILESLFLNNSGRNKKEKLAEEIKIFFTENYDPKLAELNYSLVKAVYKVRNDFMHEGNGYENKYSSSRRLHDYQGVYKGMRPFSYSGSFTSYKDLEDIKNLFNCLIDVLLSDSYIERLSIVEQIL